MPAGTVGGQRAVIETAQALHAVGRAFALVLVVRTEGSTYRKSGALALIADGVHVGAISGGCLEAGIETLAREALRAGAPRMTVFDTRSDDDLIFGSGSGCRGRMHVLALPSTAGASCAHIGAIMAAGDARRPVTLGLDALASGLFDGCEVTIRPAPQVLIKCGDNARRHRVGASDSQATVLVRPGASVTEPVAQATMGSGTRLSLILSQSRRMACFLVPPMHRNHQTPLCVHAGLQVVWKYRESARWH